MVRRRSTYYYWKRGGEWVGSLVICHVFSATCLSMDGRHFTFSSPSLPGVLFSGYRWSGMGKAGEDRASNLP